MSDDPGYHPIIPSRYPRGDESAAVRHPDWYVRRLKSRPPNLCQRGPARERRPQVEDTERIDAHDFWEHGRRPRCGEYVYEYGPTGRQYQRPADKGMRHLSFNGHTLLLERGPWFNFQSRDPSRLAHFANFRCPNCRERFRYLYVASVRVSELDGPKCRRCLGLVYNSQSTPRRQQCLKQTREAVARAKAEERPIDWSETRVPWWFRRRAFLLEYWMDQVHAVRRAERERDQRDSAAGRARRCTERLGRKEQERADRLAWRHYLRGLSSRRLQDLARSVRRSVKLIEEGRIKPTDPFWTHTIEAIECSLELLPDLPEPIRSRMVAFIAAAKPRRWLVPT